MKLFKKISAIFQTILAAVTGSIPKELRDFSDKSLQVTYGIKKVLENPVADVITAIIPGDFDDKLRKQILVHINNTLPYLIIVSECKDKGDVNEMLKCWVEKLRQQPAHTRNALLIKFAALLTAAQDGNKLKQSLYDYAVQAEYTAVVKSANYESKHKDNIANSEEVAD